MSEQHTSVHCTKLGIFFSHPTQHQSVMFQVLSETPNLDVRVYYYDPGALGQMLDKGYGNRTAWDIDLFAGTQSMILNNWLRSTSVNVMRQCNPAIVPIMWRERFDAVLVAGYVSLSNWLVLAMARWADTHVLYLSDTNVLDEQRQPPHWLKRSVRKQFLDRVDTFLTIGDKNRDVYVQLGYPTDKMVWCPYPVDIGRFERARLDPELPQKLATLRQRYGIPQDARIVAFCGKLIARKRPTDVIDAVRALNREDVYALLIGSGPLEASIKAALQEQDRVRITGFVNQSQIPYHMLLADIAVVASEWDPHPLVTTEFAACGKPIVVSHYCGVWGENDILRPGENGLVYTCGDIPALTASLQQLLGDTGRCAQMGARSLELARTQSAEAAARAIVEHLQRTLNPIPK